MSTSGTQMVAVNRYGLTEVYKPAPATVDVVFVHGLNGDPHNTWTSEKSKTFWPAQLLPPILEEERARILVYGYDADVTSFTDGVSRDKIHNHAEHLVAELAANRRIRKATERPIIFIGHSLGGLVIKRALIYSSEIRGPKTDHLRSIFVSTYGILFLGTPHKGSDLAEWGSRLGRICGAAMPKKLMDTSSHLVESLKSNNETLQNIDRQFIQLMNRYHIFFFHEGKPTDLKGTLRFVVDEESASPTVQDVERAVIQADHSHMCKFENDSAPGFDMVAEGIQRYAEAAPEMVKSRWEAEKGERSIQMRAAAAELDPGYEKRDSAKGTPNSESTSTFTASPGNSSSNLILNQSQTLSKLNPNHEATETLESPPKPSEPYFIVPPGFRANTFFVGMEKELQLLDKNLFDVRQRRVGTACVLLHGQPGGGKSHLARQYVHKNRKKFKGGIFWIQAKSKEERHQAFWIIYQKVVARLSPEACIQVNGDERSYVESVKAWFEARSEWLIVFDGVVLDKDEDTHEFQSFVPDSKSSSIIYISRAKNLESKQRLLRPYAIRVPPLKEDDARKLLFKELHIKKPTDAQAKSAKTLVKQIGGLPLAIAAISHRLADTHEPLSKFSFKSYSTDPTIGGTFNKILDDLQRVGHMEAWNLMNILCFYGQHIPVEMINLGLKALRAYPVEVKSNETGGKPDINISIGILMRYALIERNEPDDKDSKSSSRDSLVGPEPIDMLKIQSVIQKFCCDSLNAKNLLPQWLEKAVRLFSYSFQQADIKIKQKPEPGRVSDYHYYLVHGKRLVDHCTSYDSKNQRLDSIRGELDAVLEKIEQEIQNREPTSSQESISRGIFQISVFDRTSSGSESGPSIQEARTPDNRPTALLLNENEFGMDIQKPSVDSPASFRTTSPNFEPRIVANSPSLKLPGYYDPGYESDRGDFFSPLETNKTRSEGTARPQASSTESQGEGWQIVAPTRKPKKQPRRDLGTFRPTPARATVDRMSVSGSVARPAPNFDERRPSSDAFALLSEVQHRSPPRSQNGGASFWQRRPSGQSPVQHSRQTYAGVAARRPQPQSPPDINLPQSTGYDETLPGPTQMACGGSSESYRSRPAQFPSFPLSSESVPHQRQAEGVFDDDARSFAPLRVMNINDPGQHPQDPHYTFGTSASHISSSSRPRYINENINPNLSSSLPYDQEYPSSSKRPFGLSFQPPTRPFSQSPHSSSHPSLNALRLTGYYSQPMSRHTSRHSQPSLPETEPVRHTARFSSHPNSPPPGDRNRYPDGRPLPKSPKTSMPSFHEKSAPYDTTYDLSGTGGWAYPTPPPTSAVAIRDLDLAMSRSSSGPGVALSGAAGEGLGIIRFDGPGSVQFGELAPVSVEDARRRAMEHEAKLRAEEGMRGRTGYDRRRELDRTAYETRAWSEERDRRRPYPDFNLIPTNTDPVALGMMDLG